MKVLLVDDDPLALEIMKEALVAYPDYQVETCSDGVEALSRVLQGDIPLVISDWMMECMSGVDLCRYVRQADLRNYVYIILITGRGGVADVVEGLAAGADEFLRKPVGPAELNARVRSIQRLSSLTEEIARKNERLIEAQRFKNDWINMVVHDLRSPLTAILGYAQLAGGKAPPELQKPLRTIREEAGRVNGMLEQMLAIARAEEGGLTLSRSLADTGAIVAAACDSVAPLAAATQVAIEPRYPAEDCMAELDRGLIRRVLDNLLSNALRFAPEGSTVEVDLRQSGSGVEISVADLGPGVPEDARRRIFEVFATAHERSSRGSRHGLGLAYCRAVMEAHGGTIEYDDNVPRGSRFVVSIPAAVASGSDKDPEYVVDRIDG